MSTLDVPAPRGYRESRPHPALARHVRCTWTSVIDEDPAAAARRIVPDGCIDVLWRADVGLLVEGPATQANVARLVPGTAVVGIRFQPGMAPSLLGVAATELRDRSVPLGDVWGAAGRALTEQLKSLPPQSGAAALETAFLGRLAGALDPDDAVLVAIRRLDGEPALSVGELGTSLGVSTRHLLRRFGDRVGYGPRTYGRVARFQRFLRSVGQSRSRYWSLADLAAEAGYADQAHLSRECRDLAGLPPGRFLQTRRHAASDVRFVQDDG